MVNCTKFDSIMQVIYLDKEKEWAKDRSLWDSIFHISSFIRGCCPILQQGPVSKRVSEKLEYKINTTRNTRRISRNIIWYSPPYSMNVETNIAKKFLQLVSKHFPKGHKLSKVFNRNNVKVSYSCMPNVASIISTQQKSTQQQQQHHHQQQQSSNNSWL